MNRRRRRSAADSADAYQDTADSAAAEEPAPCLTGHLPAGAIPGSGRIHTEAGRYLRLTARDDTPARFGSPPGEVDDAARRVWRIAFGLLVRRRFDPASPLAEISRTVLAAVHEHSVACLPPLDAEMLIRDALGEPVPVDDIDPAVLVAVHLLVFATLADELALGDDELDAIIARAEEDAAVAVPA